MKMHNHDCEAYVICGDFNTSFLRSNAPSNCLNAFIQRNNLLNARGNILSISGYTYSIYSLNHNSYIDYFFVTENVVDLLNRCVVHYDPMNPSNHNVIELYCRCESLNIVIRYRCCA